MLLLIFKLAMKAFQTKPLVDDVRKLVMPSPEEAASDETLIEYIKNSKNCLLK